MTVEYFVSPLSRFSKWKTGKITEGALTGYTYKYRDIIIEPDKILPKGALIYVRDRAADDEPWHLARYDKYTDELYAHLVEDPSCSGDWRYALIPADIITDVAKIPSAEELIATLLININKLCTEFIKKKNKNNDNVKYITDKRCNKMTNEEAKECIRECLAFDDEESEEIIEALEHQPKTGHWISHREHCENLGVMPSGLGAYEWCSNCDCGIDIKEFHKNHYNYCPNCGAKMEVEEC